MPGPVQLTRLGEELEKILADAYKIPGGLAELNRVIEPKLGINSIRDLTGESSRMVDVIAALRVTIEASDQTLHKAVLAFYTALPGYAALRDWARRNLSAEDQALVPEALFEQERAAYEESRKFGRDQQTAAIGLGVLRASAGDAAIANVLKDSGRMLEAAMQQLQLVKFHKVLHDRLHNVQTKAFARFAAMLLRPELDDTDRKEIAEHVTAFRDDVPWLKTTVDLLRTVDRTFDDSWIAGIADIFSLLDPAESVDRAKLRQAMTKLRSALSAQLTTLNRGLIDGARAIPFGRLAELLGDGASASDGETAAQLKAAAAAVRQIDVRLKKTIASHDSWQELDTFLWGFELAYPAAAFDPGQREDIGAYWHDTIVALAEDLTGGDAVEWNNIRAAADGFDAALHLEPPTITALGTAYFFFAAAIRDRFFQIDKALLDECTSLVALEPDLRALTKEQA